MTDIATQLHSRQRLLGTVLTLPDPSLAELVGSSFDFAWIDLEHGALDVGHLNGLAVGLRAAGAASFVRIPDMHTDRLGAIVDTGVDGIVVPRVASPEEASALVRRLRLPPDGDRGFGPRRAGDYGRTQPTASPLCVVQVETGEGCRSAERIGRIDGVDAIVVGAADLSYDVGCPGDSDAPQYRAAIETARAGAEEGGVAFGIAAGDPTLIAELSAPTGSIGVISVDVRIFASAIDEARRSLNDAFARTTISATP